MSKAPQTGSSVFDPPVLQQHGAFSAFPKPAHQGSSRVYEDSQAQLTQESELTVCFYSVPVQDLDLAAHSGLNYTMIFHIKAPL